MVIIKVRVLHTILLSTFFLLSGCHLYGPQPGEGVKAEYYYTKAAPIIDALERYYGVNKHYPVRLNELQPDFLENVDWPEHMYESTGTSYELWFRYQGPGSNACIYQPAKGWKCVGMI